jgi:hypothetical protein
MIAFLSISEAVTPPAPISSERTTSTYEGIITIRTLQEITRRARETNTTEGNR